MNNGLDEFWVDPVLLRGFFDMIAEKGGLAAIGDF
jgi:hypothetical protein